MPELADFLAKRIRSTGISQLELTVGNVDGVMTAFVRVVNDDEYYWYAPFPGMDQNQVRYLIGTYMAEDLCNDLRKLGIVASYRSIAHKGNADG